MSLLRLHWRSRSAARPPTPPTSTAPAPRRCLAANVAEAQGTPVLAFEETGAYRLLLPAMSEDPAELQRFHDETVAPLIAYDEQYETELVTRSRRSSRPTATSPRPPQKLFTHRHTDPLPARAGARADRARRVLHRRPRAPRRSASRRCACSASWPPDGPATSTAPRPAGCPAARRTARPGSGQRDFCRRNRLSIPRPPR